MMSVGVRELKAQTSRILRRVRDRGEEIQVTYRGRTIARLVPASRPQRTGAARGAVWSDLDRLAAEIGARWPSDRSVVEAIREGRRGV
jgi:prevent-host-death family protein